MTGPQEGRDGQELDDKIEVLAGHDWQAVGPGEASRHPQARGVGRAGRPAANGAVVKVSRRASAACRSGQAAPWPRSMASHLLVAPDDAAGVDGHAGDPGTSAAPAGFRER